MYRGTRRTEQVIGVLGALLGVSAVANAATIDFDNDGRADILWHHGGTGGLQVWHMNGATRIAAEQLAATLKSGSAYTCVGVNDFNNDGHVDLLWHNGVTGDTQIWYMNGSSRTSTVSLGSSLNVVDSSGWRVIGTADFDRDGHIDILWHNGVTGDTQVWYMNGNARTGATTFDSGLNVVDSSGWSAVGTGDFNRDGMPDILWHNGQTGDTQIWYMNNVTRIGAVGLSASLNVSDSSGWTIVGADDFDNDGNVDIVWHNGQTGDTQIWGMNNTTRVSIMQLPQNLQVSDTTGWRVIDGANQTLQASSSTASASDPYAARTVAMTAFNTVQTTDPTLNGLGITLLNVATDSSGQTVRMQGTTGSNDFIDYYVSFPNTLPSGAPDTSYFTFDLKDSTGEFAGFQDLWSWVDPQGVKHVFSDQQINGEYHSMEFTVDGAGNVIDGSGVQVKATTRPDRCKIISDWGALQCPRSFDGPKEIPTTVQRRALSASWFTKAVGTVWNKVSAAANVVGKVLRSPVTQVVLIVVGTFAVTIACIFGTAGALGWACVWGGLAIDLAAFGDFLKKMDDPTNNRTSPLQSAGVLACDDPACGSTGLCATDPCDTGWYCLYTPSASGQCAFGWVWHGADVSIKCNGQIARTYRAQDSSVGGYCQINGVN